MLIVSIPEEGEGETIFQSWWRFPEIKGYEKGTPEYETLQRMWEQRTGKRIPRCYDNQGKILDRYTIVIGNSVYTMSHNALSPNGVDMYCCEAEGIVISDPEIEFADLPNEVQEAVRRRMDPEGEREGD